jgi:hypothetical protein
VVHGRAARPNWDHEDRFFATVFLGSGLLFLATIFIFSGVAMGRTVRLISSLSDNHSNRFQVAVRFARHSGRIVKHEIERCLPEGD